MLFFPVDALLVFWKGHKNRMNRMDRIGTGPARLNPS